MQLLILLVQLVGAAAAGSLQFQAKLFAPGMILQRGSGTKVCFYRRVSTSSSCAWGPVSRGCGCT